MKVNQHNASSFAKLLGVQRSSLSHILNGRNNPSLDFLAKLLKSFPNVDANWLLTGVEPASREKDAKPEIGNSQTRQVESQVHHSPVKKRIHKIVVFYDDKSFDEYEPN